LIEKANKMEDLLLYQKCLIGEDDKNMYTLRLVCSRELPLSEILITIKDDEKELLIQKKTVQLKDLLQDHEIESIALDDKNQIKRLA